MTRRLTAGQGMAGLTTQVAVELDVNTILMQTTLNTAGTAVAGGAAGFTGGLVASGGSFDAGLKGAVAGSIFGGVSGLTGEWSLAPRLLAKAASGGLTSTLYGAPFAEGFTSSFLTAGSAEAYQYVTGYLPDPLPGEALPGGAYEEALGVPRGYGVFGFNRALTDNFFADFFKQGGAVGRLANLLPIFNAGAAFHDSLFVRGFLDENLLTNVLTIVPSGIVTVGAVLDGPLTVQLSLAGKRRWR